MHTSVLLTVKERLGFFFSQSLIVNHWRWGRRHGWNVAKSVFLVSDWKRRGRSLNLTLQVMCVCVCVCVCVRAHAHAHTCMHLCGYMSGCVWLYCMSMLVCLYGVVCECVCVGGRRIPSRAWEWALVCISESNTQKWIVQREHICWLSMRFYWEGMLQGRAAG